MTTHPSGIPHLSVDETHRRREAGELVLIDVRMPQEWHETGLPKGSRGATLQAPDFIEQVRQAVGDSAQPVAFSCAVGARSLQAAVVARAHGFDEVYNVDGGFGAWHAAELPVEPAED